MPGGAAPWDAVADEGRYERWVISPFARGVDFRLRGDVRRLLARWKRTGGIERRVVLDLGCGRGDGLALVAGRVGFAAGLDFSPRMLDLAARVLATRDVTTSRYRGRTGRVRLAADLRAVAAGTRRGPRTALAEADMRDLALLRGSADLVIAVLSISPARATETSRVFHEVARSLKPGGVLMGVLASLDAFHYLLDLADRRGVRLDDVGRMDDEGMFHEGGETQKFFAPAEIRTLCRASGLRVLALTKVRYPWALMRRFGWGWFPGRPRLWDWHLVAQRPR
jgi:SAM-dependent methyltransferase